MIVKHWSEKTIRNENFRQKQCLDFHDALEHFRVVNYNGKTSVR